MTFAQAAELTWPQLMHALDTGSAATDASVARDINARQDEIFSRITARRRCLPVDLLRIPAKDLAAEVQAETAGSAANLELFIAGLSRFVASLNVFTG